MTKKLKEEYQPGGSKRHVILEKAIEYLKDPRFGLQGHKLDKTGFRDYKGCRKDKLLWKKKKQLN